MVIAILISININNNNMFSFRGDGLCVWLAVGPVMFRDDVVLFQSSFFLYSSVLS